MIEVLLLRNVLPNSKFGGIRKHCQELYELFKNDSQIKILPVENLPNHLVPLLHKRVYYWKQLYQYIRCSDCDIVHVHGFATLDIIQVFIVARILKKKIVYSPHYHPFKYLQRPLFGRLYFYCCLRYFLNLATSIITITRNDTDFFVHYHKKFLRFLYYRLLSKYYKLFSRNRRLLIPTNKRNMQDVPFLSKCQKVLLKSL